MYKCGKSFDIMNDNSTEQRYYVDLSMSKAVVYVIYDTARHVVETITSGIPSQHGKGGQSQQRFTRKHNEAVKSFLLRVKTRLKELEINDYEVGGNSFLSLP